MRAFNQFLARKIANGVPNDMTIDSTATTSLPVMFMTSRPSPRALRGPQRLSRRHHARSDAATAAIPATAPPAGPHHLSMSELKLKPGWLARDVTRASERAEG